MQNTNLDMSQPKPQRPGGARPKKQKVEVEVKVEKKVNPPKRKNQNQNQKKNRPPQPRWSMNKSRTRVVTMDGFDYLGTITLTPDDKIGALKSIISVCPSAWAGTRIQREAALWQRYRPRSLVLEVTSSANRMMGGQYLTAWSADSDDPMGTPGEGALSKLMSYNPSRLAAISSNIRMRIPISLTQKWYYLRGSEDKDVEYGKIFIAVVSPLSNVTGASKTNLVVRMRWVFDLSYPDLPTASLPEEEVFASAPNYFSDSSSDWKQGKYLTFKWHEGGSIVDFPGAKAKHIYKIHPGSTVGYYASNGTLQTTQYAVCVTETTSTGQPMLAPVATLADAQAYVKSPQDSKLISYYSQGPWISPENPPWHEQDSSVQLLLVHREFHKEPMIKTPSTVTVSDSGVAASAASLNKLSQTTMGTRKGDRRDPLFGLVAQASHAINTLNDTMNVLMQRGSYDPQDPQLGDLEIAISKLKQLSFRNLIIESPLKVFNENPIREDIPSTSKEETKSTTSSVESPFEHLGDIDNSV
ncbi:MAG: capsid protein [Sanya permutotetra-like virus 3]|nr:MAG: capsid protein [Sanya permutotetra-like virus 3]